jgi:hypothetical protein
MTRIKKYGEETVLYSKRVPRSSFAAITEMVENYLSRFEGNVSGKIIVVDQKWPTGENPTTRLEIDVNAGYIGPINPEAKLIITETVGAGFGVTKPKINLVPKSNNGIIQYPCGCYNDGFYRRVGNCKIKVGDHN